MTKVSNPQRDAQQLSAIAVPARRQSLFNPAVFAALALAFVLGLSFSSPSQASGGYGGYSSTPSAPAFDSRKYNLGKKLFVQKVNCKDCPVNYKSFDKKTAKDLLKRIRKDEAFTSILSKKERRAVRYFVKKRMKI